MFFTECMKPIRRRNLPKVRSKCYFFYTLHKHFFCSLAFFPTLHPAVQFVYEGKCQHCASVHNQWLFSVWAKKDRKKEREKERRGESAWTRFIIISIRCLTASCHSMTFSLKCDLGPILLTQAGCSASDFTKFSALCWNKKRNIFCSCIVYVLFLLIFFKHRNTSFEHFAGW